VTAQFLLPPGHHFTVPNGYGVAIAWVRVGTIFNRTKQQSAAERTVLFSLRAALVTRERLRLD
jgi:hypothetical protein